MPILTLDAELVLQVGERLLDHCEEALNYRRANRSKGLGDLTLVLRCNRLSDFIGIVPVVSFR